MKLISNWLFTVLALTIRFESLNVTKLEVKICHIELRRNANQLKINFLWSTLYRTQVKINKIRPPLPGDRKPTLRPQKLLLRALKHLLVAWKHCLGQRKYRLRARKCYLRTRKHPLRVRKYPLGALKHLLRRQNCLLSLWKHDLFTCLFDWITRILAYQKRISNKSSPFRWSYCYPYLCAYIRIYLNIMTAIRKHVFF